MSFCVLDHVVELVEVVDRLQISEAVPGLS